MTPLERETHRTVIDTSRQLVRVRLLADLPSPWRNRHLAGDALLVPRDVAERMAEDGAAEIVGGVSTVTKETSPCR